MDLTDARALFPVARRLVYCNHAAVSPLAKPTRDVMTAMVDDVYENGALHWLRWGEDLARVRTTLAGLVKAPAEDIALIKNTSEGLAIAAQGLAWKPGDRVVAFDCEFPANLYPWLALRARGVEATLLPEAALLDLDRVRAACRGARLLSVSFVQYLSGLRAPLAEIGAICRESGTWFVVDAIQGLGAFPVDVGACGIHLLTADGHKWLTGPEGAGFAYVHPELLTELTPHEIGWMSVEPWADFTAAERAAESLTLPPWRQGAARFECGTLNTAGLVGLGAAVELLQAVGGETIAGHILGLNRQLTAGLRGLGAEVLRPAEAPERCSGIVSFRHPRAQAAAVVAQLEAAGITCANRNGWVRVSPHFYNTADEMERLLHAAARVGA